MFRMYLIYCGNVSINVSETHLYQTAQCEHLKCQTGLSSVYENYK